MTNDCEIDGRNTQLRASSTDAATGVKQLSALAAPGGGGDVIDPGRLFKQPLSARQHKARGVMGVTMSSNGSHLFGCHGSTGEPWVGGFQNISPGKDEGEKNTAPQA